MNLRLKLFLPFVALFIAICCLITFYLLPSYTAYFEDEQIKNETAQIELLSVALAPDVLGKDIDHLSKYLDEALAKRKHWHSIALIDQFGSQLYPEKQEQPTAPKDYTTISTVVASEGITYGSLQLKFDPAPGMVKPIGYADFLHHIVLVSIILTFLLMCIFLDRHIRRPMVKLSGFAEQIANGNYKGLLTVNSADEVGSLGKSLETMREKIHQRDITMNQYAEIQNTIRFIQSKFISTQDDSHVFMELQCRILALTKSEAGLIGEIYSEDDQVPQLKVLAAYYASNIQPRRNFANKALLPQSNNHPASETLLGKVITSGKPVLDNGANISNSKIGFAAFEESTIDNFLGLPLYSGYELIGVMGLINREGGYDQRTFNELEILLQTLAQLIVALRERKALTDSESRLRLVVDSAIEGIFSVNEYGLITSLNKAAERIFGYSAKQLIGQSVGLLIPPENHYNHLEAVRFLLDADNINNRANTEIETDALHRNGKLIPVELSFSRVTANGVIQYTGVVRDITERKQHESDLNKAYAELQEAHEQLEKQNSIDSLTNLANRGHLDEALKLEWKRAQRMENSPLTIMLCDIDYFKKYNDTYGHLQGDDCLIKVAKTMAESFTRKIDLVARYGGEEFMIVLPNTSAMSAVKQADIMREQIWNLDIEHKASPIADRVTLSIGIYTVKPTLNHKLRKAIQRADEALYDAKDNGRNQVFHYDKMKLEMKVATPSGA